MKRTHFLIILMILMCYLATSYVILTRDEIPQLFDAGICYDLSLHFYNRLSTDFKTIFSNINFYPPLYMLVPLPFYALFGPSQDALGLINVVYLGVLVFSLYKINESLNKSGLLAVVVALTMPAIAAYYRVTHLVTATAAVVSLWFYFLIKTDSFTNKKYSLWCGSALGVGMLASFHFACYIIGPFVIYAVQSLVFGTDTKRKAQNVAYCLLASLFIAGIWYIPAFALGNFKNILSIQFNPRPDWLQFGFGTRFSDNFNFIEELALLTNLAFFLFFWVWSLCKRQSLRVLLPVGLGWFVCSLCIVSLFTVPPETRYVLPILPSLSIIVAYGFAEVFKNFRRSTIILFGFFWFLFCTAYFRFTYKIPANGFEMMLSRVHYGIIQPYGGDPQSASLAAYLQQREGRKEFTLAVITENELDPGTFSIELLRRKFALAGMRVKFHNAMSLCLDYPKDGRMQRAADGFRQAKYVLLIISKNNHVTTRPEYDPRVNKTLKSLFAVSDKKLLRIFSDPSNFFQHEFSLYEIDREN